MIKTIEALIDEQGNVHLLEAIHLAAAHRALVTILEEQPTIHIIETALLSEPALEDWLKPEEDTAWSHLQAVT